MNHSPRFTPESAARRLAGLAAARANNPRNCHPWTSQDSDYAIARRKAGDTFDEIAAALDRSKDSVKNHVKYYAAKRRPLPMEPMTVAPAKPYPGVARCKCGLALPCNSCLPGIESYATARRV